MSSNATKVLVVDSATQNAQLLVERLRAMQPEMLFGTFPLSDYDQFAELDAPDVLEALWSTERDGWTHKASGLRVVPCGPCSYAVLKAGRQVRGTDGRRRRWRCPDKARAYVEQQSL